MILYGECDATSKNAVNLFREEQAIGRLMLLEPDPNSRFKFTIWFDYTRKLVNKVKEGDLIAIPNFAGDERYCLSEIIGVLPTHFAMATDIKGYPGFLMDAAKSASQDWIVQEEKSYEDTTKIVCHAIPMNLEFLDKPGIESLEDVPVQPESSLPMPGKEVRLVSSELTEQIINYALTKEINTFTIGTLLRDEKVKVNVSIEDLVKTHFGVFGYTGVGKSNLISTLIGKLLLNERDTVNVCLFDLMGEYLGLLVDLLTSQAINATIICLGPRTLPGPTLDFVAQQRIAPPAPAATGLDVHIQASRTAHVSTSVPPTGDLDSAAEALLDSTLLPKKLKSMSNEYLPYFKQILQSRRVRILREGFQQTLRSLIEQNDNAIYGRLGEPKRIALQQLLANRLGQLMDRALSPEVATQAIGISRAERGEFAPRLAVLIQRLTEVLNQPQVDVRPEFSITIQDIVAGLNSRDRKSLYVILSHDPDLMRTFSDDLISEVFEQRRRRGWITPLCTFVFDEADEFIPLNISPGSTYYDSTEAIETLARRGRKYGLGVGIATQRVTYLNTSIMAQPHTYFVSKLPRETDRQRVSEAFAIGEDILAQTFEFHKGNWLVMSHDALGVEGIPVPIKAENAENRITTFFTANRPNKAS